MRNTFSLEELWTIMKAGYYSYEDIDRNNALEDTEDRLRDLKEEFKSVLETFPHTHIDPFMSDIIDKLEDD